MIYGLTLIFLILTYFFIRFVWIVKNINEFLAIMISYSKFGNIPISDISEACKLSSFWKMMLELDNWMFTKYIIDKKIYYDACKFHIKLVLNDLENKENK